MKKLITLILVAALCYGGYQVLQPQIARAKAQSAIEKDPEKSREYIAENLLNGKFISILSDKQLEKIAEKVKSSHWLEQGTIREYLENLDIQPEELYEGLKDRVSIQNLRDRATDVLTQHYCEEKGISPEEADPEEVRAYQKEKISQLVGACLDRLKEAK